MISTIINIELVIKSFLLCFYNIKYDLELEIDNPESA